MKSKFSHILIWREDSRPDQLKLRMNLYAEFNFQVETTQILHLDPPQNIDK